MRVFRSSELLQSGTGYNRRLDNVQIFPYDRYYNRGQGVGSLLSSLYSTMVPLVKSALRIGSKALNSPVGRAVKEAAKRTALEAGMNVVNAGLEGKNVLASAKQELSKARTSFKDRLKNIPIGGRAGGAKKKKKTKKKKQKRGAPKAAGGKKKKKKAGAAKNTSAARLKPSAVRQFLDQLRRGAATKTGKPAAGGKKRKKMIKLIAAAGKKTKGRRGPQRTKVDLFDVL
jgi:hypothetical protein